MSDWRDGPPIFNVQSPGWSANGTTTTSSGVSEGRLKFSDTVTGLPVTVDDIEHVGEGVGEVQVSVSTGPGVWLVDVLDDVLDDVDAEEELRVETGQMSACRGRNFALGTS
jgi:hypothetical protein